MIFNQLKGAVEFASHLPRYREIIAILWKYGFADVLRLVALQRFLGIDDATIAVHEEGLLSKPVPERVRLALGELGPTFVKFGQIVSSRRDLVTDEYYVELCKLQTQVPPFPAAEAKAIIAEELGRPISEVFKRFQDKPVGSASIAQVHAARLSDGTKVAVKVQRPDIEEVIELDLAMLLDLARFMDRHVPEISGVNPIGVVMEFSSILRKELDFNNEALNIERFGAQFADNPWIKVPTVYREFTHPARSDDGVLCRAGTSWMLPHWNGRVSIQPSSPNTLPSSFICRSSNTGFFMAIRILATCWSYPAASPACSTMG